MRVLLISSFLPRDPKIHRFGTYHRLKLFVDAIKEFAQIDGLFYVRPDIDFSPSAIRTLQRSLSEHWEVNLNLQLCPQLEIKEPQSRWRRLVSNSLTLLNQSSYRSTSGPLQIQALDACLQRRPDAIFAHRLTSMCPLIKFNRQLPPIFFDLDDIEHISQLRIAAQQPGLRSKLASYSQLPSLLLLEQRAIRLAHKTFVCSERDRTYLTRRWRVGGVTAIPNAVNATQRSPLTKNRTLLFLGSYMYQPNIEAARFLLQQIWPRVSREIPDARLIIAGPFLERSGISDLPAQSVEFAGFVDDLDALYARSRVVCAPIFSGSGTRIKIIEAAAYGKPVVSTHIGIEGLDLKDGVEVQLRDDPNEFATACARLITDDTLCERLGSAAHAAVTQRYNRARVVHLIQQHFNMTTQPQSRSVA
jgi:glycosyltransferase involved in cell wall biosynthesis